MNQYSYKTLQKLLSTYRIDKAMTQKEIAVLLNKPQSYVSKYESGERRLDIGEFLHICKILEVDLNELCKKADNVNSRN